MLRVLVPELNMDLPPIAGWWWIIPVLSTAHIFYLVLWLYPTIWIAFTIALSQKERPEWVEDKTLAVSLEHKRGNQAAILMSNAAHFIKIVQFSALYYWTTLYAPDTVSLVSHATASCAAD